MNPCRRLARWLDTSMDCAALRRHEVCTGFVKLNRPPWKGFCRCQCHGEEFKPMTYRPSSAELLAQIDRLGEARRERHERWERWGQ